MRWNSLIRHGVLGTGLMAAARSPVLADRCDYGSADRVIAITAALEVWPRVSVAGGLEGRLCIADRADAAARIELDFTTLVPRLVVSGRVYPVVGHNRDAGVERIAAEGGLSLDTHARFGLHAAAVYGSSHVYGGVQGYLPLRAPASAPPIDNSVSLLLSAGPWHWGESNNDDYGRPLAIAGRTILPRVVRRRSPGRSGDDRAVAAHFERAARAEYSSVWTFMRLAAELAAVGAPVTLIVRALDAADDEVRHAEACAQAAHDVALMPLPAAAARARFPLPSKRALFVLAAEGYDEGCLHEGAAALEAEFGAELAQDDTAPMLAMIARDEAAHAELAWAVLAWVASVAPDVATAAVASVNMRSEARPAPTDALLAARGVPTRDVVQASHAQAWARATDRVREMLA